MAPRTASPAGTPRAQPASLLALRASGAHVPGLARRTPRMHGSPAQPDVPMPPLSLPPKALEVAGFVLAHAAWSVSDTRGDDVLCPLAMVERDGGRRLMRFEAATNVDAVARGKKVIADLTESADAWAFAREGMAQDDQNPDAGCDVLTLEFWARGMDAPVAIVQRFDRPSKAGRFVVRGVPEVLVAGSHADEETAAEVHRGMMAGVQAHPKVADLWREWQEA